MNLEQKKRETIYSQWNYGLRFDTNYIPECSGFEITAVTKSECVEYFDEDSGHELISFKEIKIHLFSMEMLTKPIRVEGFNGGKEFIFVELWEVGDDGDVFMGVEFDHGNTKLIEHLKSIAEHNIYEDLKYLPCVVVDTMRKLHFNTEGLPPTHYIDAHQSQVYSPK